MCEINIVSKRSIFLSWFFKIRFFYFKKYMCISVAYCHGLQRQVHGTLPFLAVPWHTTIADCVGCYCYWQCKPPWLCKADTLRGCRQWRPWSLLLVQWQPWLPLKSTLTTKASCPASGTWKKGSYRWFRVFGYFTPLSIPFYVMIIWFILM